MAPVPPGAAKGDYPWWLVALAVVALALAGVIVANDLYRQVFGVVLKGLWVTIFVTLVAFLLATVLGLGFALMALSESKVLRQVARFYTEVIRGVPILVLLFYIAFVGAPALVAIINFIVGPLVSASFMEPVQVRDLSLMWRAVIALVIGSSALLPEVFRAGIPSLGQGPGGGAHGPGPLPLPPLPPLGPPPAVRPPLPPLGNDFVAMVKDSSLVSVLGVADITQMGKVYASGSFRFFETYSIVAYVYLFLTIGLSLALRALEKRLRRGIAP